MIHVRYDGEPGWVDGIKHPFTEVPGIAMVDPTTPAIRRGIRNGVLVPCDVNGEPLKEQASEVVDSEPSLPPELMALVDDDEDDQI